MYNSTIQELKKRKNRYIIIPMKKGSWLKPAERRLTGFDPQPDLDNANVGKYKSLMDCMRFGMQSFLYDGNSKFRSIPLWESLFSIF